MKRLKFVSIIGTRPQYIKHAALNYEINKRQNIELVTIDTGQHYDQKMSMVFIKELNIDSIKYNLSVRSKYHGEQTGLMLVSIEKILIKENPDYVVVYGDTNSTLSGSLAAAKLNFKIVHVEAGLRNFNMSVPEEINRVLTDKISSVKIAPTKVALDNLLNENLSKHAYLFGDIITDVIYNSNITKRINTPREYYFATIHRPINTSSITRLKKIFFHLNSLNKKIIIPLHPRTKNKMNEFGIKKSSYTNMNFIEPLSFYENLKYMSQSNAVITDSGGVQKEAYILKKKCVSILSFTPWEETLIGEWNQLVFKNLESLEIKLNTIPDKNLYMKNYFGDGNIAKKVINLLLSME